MLEETATVALARVVLDREEHAATTSLALGLLFGALGVSGVLVGAGLVLRLRQTWPGIVPALIAFAASSCTGVAGLLDGRGCTA